jgi:hypothetical protein
MMGMNASIVGVDPQQLESPGEVLRHPRLEAEGRPGHGMGQGQLEGVQGLPRQTTEQRRA